MSSKQIARSVLNGHLVTFAYERMPPVIGYVAGMDEYHWLVLDPTSGKRRLIHKGLSPIIEIEESSSYLELDVDHLRRLEEVLAPFRRKLAERFGPDNISIRAAARLEGANPT